MANYTERVQRLIWEREPFKVNHISAQQGGRFDPYAYGLLRPEEREIYRDDALADRIIYAVWSYGTPIAWQRKDGSVYYVQQHFSATTKRHQTITRAGMTGAHRS